MNFQEMVDKIRASEIPVGALAAAGIVIGLVALKAGKTGSRFLFSLISSALFCGAVWWHMQRR